MQIINGKTIRQTTVLLAAISLAVSLSACGGGTSSTTAAETTTPAAATTTDTAPATAATTAPATTTTAPAAATPAPAATTPAPAAPSAGSLGKIAWSNNCVACHGSDTGKGKNASKTMGAIAANTGGMGILNGKITATDANNISAYTANPGAY
jgi:mono/diheme cytochrome c family protein